jgi:formyl-CoA transferase
VRGGDGGIRTFPRPWRAFGQPELATNELFATNAGRSENAAALYAILQSEFEARDLAEWAAIFKRSDVKWAPLPKLDDVVKDRQLRDADAIIELSYPGAGVIETVNSPVLVTGVEKRKPTATPEVGAHTREILLELGYRGKELEALLRNGDER